MEEIDIGRVGIRENQQIKQPQKHSLKMLLLKLTSVQSSFPSSSPSFFSPSSSSSLPSFPSSCSPPSCSPLTTQFITFHTPSPPPLYKLCKYKQYVCVYCAVLSYTYTHMSVQYYSIPILSITSLLTHQQLSITRGMEQ